MSKNVEKASKKVHEEPQNDSVFDFLYCDYRRIASFLAQFDDSGHLEKIIQKESAQKSSKRGWSATIGGGSPLLASANASLSMSPEAGGSEASERIYDPLWANARTFLDYLYSANLIQRDAEKARIGQFVLVSGSLSIFDMSLIRAAWEIPAIQKAMRDASSSNGEGGSALSRQQRRAHKVSHPQKPDDEIAGILDFLKILPHKVISSIQFGDQNIWSILNESFISGSSTDIALKHGIYIQGQWSVLGILDALPSNSSEDEVLRNVIGAFGLSSMGEMLSQIAPIMRMMMGRPLSAYGVTPLLIFREIQA